MDTGLMFLVISFIIIFIIAYRRNTGENVYKYIVRQVGVVYDKYAPYSFKVVREKVKDLGQEYSPKQYAIQISVFALVLWLFRICIFTVCFYR